MQRRGCGWVDEEKFSHPRLFPPLLEIDLIFYRLPFPAFQPLKARVMSSSSLKPNHRSVKRVTGKKDKTQNNIPPPSPSSRSLSNANREATLLSSTTPVNLLAAHYRSTYPAGTFSEPRFKYDYETLTVFSSKDFIQGLGGGPDNSYKKELRAGVRRATIFRRRKRGDAKKKNRKTFEEIFEQVRNVNIDY